MTLDQLISQVERMRETGATADARTCLLNAIDQHGQDRRFLATLQTLDPAPEDVRTVALHLFERGPSAPTLVVSLADALLEVSYPADALRIATAATEMPIDDPRLAAAAHHLRARALDDLGQLDAALEEFRIAHDIHPGGDDNVAGYAYGLIRVGRILEARRVVERGLVVHPDSDRLRDLSGSLAEMGEFRMALIKVEAPPGSMFYEPGDLDPRTAVAIARTPEEFLDMVDQALAAHNARRVATEQIHVFEQTPAPGTLESHVERLLARTDQGSVSFA